MEELPELELELEPEPEPELEVEVNSEFCAVVVEEPVVVAVEVEPVVVETSIPVSQHQKQQAAH